jgi:hypothetical protein
MNQPSIIPNTFGYLMIILLWEKSRCIGYKGSHGSGCEGFYWYKMSCNSWNSADISEEHVTSIFRVEEWTNLEMVLLAACFMLVPWLTLQPWRQRQYILLKRELTSSGLHAVISQNTELSSRYTQCNWWKTFVYTLYTIHSLF